MIEGGELRAKLNGAIRDALRKEKVPFIEVSTDTREGNVIFATVVADPKTQDAVKRVFVEVAKRFKGTDVRLELKTPEELALEKAATLRIVLQSLTDSDSAHCTLASIAERAHEPTWVIEGCLRALAAKDIVQTVGEYEENPTWTIATKNPTYETAIAAAKEKGFDVG